MAQEIFAVGARDGIAVTPNDTTSYGLDYLDALYIGGAGNVAVVTAGGTTLTFVGAVAGSIIPVQCQKVMATNTTATSIVGLRF